MLTDYDSEKFPAAPVLEIKISPPRESVQTEAMPALVDTGADFTIIPLNWLLQVDAPAVRWAFLRGLWSEQRQVTLYLVDLYFDDIVLPALEVVGLGDDQIEFDDEREAVLGRNVLNRLILLLDGPQQRIDILERRPVKF